MRPTKVARIRIISIIVGQVIPVLNNFEVESNEAKIIRPRYDVALGQFLGLVETRGYLTVCGDESERFLDFGYLKDNSKILYSTCKKKNS